MKEIAVQLKMLHKVTKAERMAGPDLGDGPKKSALAGPLFRRDDHGRPHVLGLGLHSAHHIQSIRQDKRKKNKDNEEGRGRRKRR